jgi:hypothetical protein
MPPGPRRLAYIVIRGIEGIVIFADDKDRENFIERQIFNIQYSIPGWETIMGIKFGQFLINKGKVTETQLKRALASQAEEQIEFGQIAVILGKMEHQQVDIVRKAMTEKKHSGKSVGEVAKAFNFISANDLYEILEMEEELNNRIGKILTMSGYITQAEIDTCLKEFKELA